MPKTLVSMGKDQLVTFKLKNAAGALVTGQQGTLNFKLVFTTLEDGLTPQEEDLDVNAASVSIETTKQGIYAVVVPGSQTQKMEFADLIISANGAVNDIVAEFENSGNLSDN